MLSEDRKGEGLALGLSVADNLTAVAPRRPRSRPDGHPVAAGARHRALDRARRHPVRRSAATGRRVVRRQSAEGRARPAPPSRRGRAAPRRADARHRRREQGPINALLDALVSDAAARRRACCWSAATSLSCSASAVTTELPTSRHDAFVIEGGPDGAVRYSIIVTSAVGGGQLIVQVDPDGTVLEVDPVWRANENAKNETEPGAGRLRRRGSCLVPPQPDRSTPRRLARDVTHGPAHLRRRPQVVFCDRKEEVRPRRAAAPDAGPTHHFTSRLLAGGRRARHSTRTASPPAAPATQHSSFLLMATYGTGATPSREADPLVGVPVAPRARRRGRARARRPSRAAPAGAAGHEP